MAICDWPTDQQPREKLLKNGVSILSDAELLAVFLRTGCVGKSAVDVARDLLEDFGGIRNLINADKTEFCRGKGLGEAKYAQLQAVMEIAKRHIEETLNRDHVLNSPQAVKDYLTAQLRHLDHETFAIIYLDSQHRLIGYENLFNGTIDGASVYSREVVKKCLDRNAAAVIFAHNHPSGVAEPSDADLRLTQRLIDALGLMDIRVLDHIIVGDGENASFAELGLI